MRARARYVQVDRKDPAGVAERWKAQYFRNGTWYKYASVDGEAVYRALAERGSGISHDDVAKIIGNPSWCGSMCDSCHASVPATVRIGDYANDDTKGYCIACISEAMEIGTAENIAGAQ